jgi:hypothetical protein
MCGTEGSLQVQEVSAGWTRLTGPRILGLPERGYLTLQKACSSRYAAAASTRLVEIARTAKAHNVSTLSLADALVALAQYQVSQNADDAALIAARSAWGHLLTRKRQGARCGRRREGIDDEDEVMPGA